MLDEFRYKCLVRIMELKAKIEEYEGLKRRKISEIKAHQAALRKEMQDQEAQYKSGNFQPELMS